MWMLLLSIWCDDLIALLYGFIDYYYYIYIYPSLSEAILDFTLAYFWSLLILLAHNLPRFGFEFIIIDDHFIINCPC